MTDLPRGNLKIPYLWARRRRENFGVLPWFSREIPIKSAETEQNFLAAEGGRAQKGQKTKISDFWEIWDFLTRGGFWRSARRGGFWPGSLLILSSPHFFHEIKISNLQFRFWISGKPQKWSFQREDNINIQFPIEKISFQLKKWKFWKIFWKKVQIWNFHF